MNPEEWRRIKEAAAQAIERPAAQRADFLATTCGGDAALREAVERLLEASDAAAGLYENPLLAHLSAAPNAAITAGMRIGPYEVVRELGRGGMGAVYVADRVEGGFSQRVAIKFVGSITSSTLLQRFSEERRILATLEHPNIARLLDGGTTAGGLPYLIMEFVDGVPIDEYCNRHHLPLQPRLDIFRQLCGAVHYAHQRLVVHRDIKASNILVTADGVPKLLDFGIAKIVEPVDGSAALQRTLIRALTPESASPEQVRGEPITIATDVYSLGVLLYRLLTGHGPYGADHPSQAELLRRVCDITPPAPSSVVGADGSLPAIPRDLDLIVLKALRKEPERRYGSAEQLSDDLDRLTRRLPVAAAPDSRRYRLRKFGARHKIALGSAAIALFAIVAGAATAVYQAQITRRERTRAEQRFADVRRLANSFMFEVHDAVADLPGGLPVRQLVAKRAAEYLDSLAAEAQNDVALQRELAAANTRLADILGGGGVSNLGDLEQAERRYAQALELRQALASRPGAELADIDGLAQARVLVSRFLILRGELARSEASAQAAVDGLLQAPGVHAGNVATAYHQLGFVQARRGRIRDALASLEEATYRAKQQVNAAPQDTREIARLARIAIDYGEQLQAARRHAEAVTTLRDAQALVEGLITREPLNPRYQYTLMLALSFEGASHDAEGRFPEAIDRLTRATAIGEELVRAEPGDINGRLSLMMSRYALAMAHIHAGDAAIGTPALRRAVTEAEAIVRDAPGNAFALNQLASARVELGATLIEADPAGREGCRVLAAGLDDWKTLRDQGRLPGESGQDRTRFERMHEQCGRLPGR